MPSLLEQFDAAAAKREVVVRAQRALDTPDAAGWTALMVASFKGDVFTATQLLLAGASKDTAAVNGDTAMSVAAQALKNDVGMGWGYIAAVRMAMRALIIHDGDAAAAKLDQRHGEDCPYDALCD